MTADFQRLLQVALAVAISGAVPLNAQTNAAEEFEVVSIKAHSVDDPTQQDP